MTEETIQTIEACCGDAVPNNPPVIRVRPKRDIFRFAGEKPSAINLEHVTQINVEGKKITFQFYNTAMFVEFDTEEATNNAFEQIINVWSADVLA